MIAALAFYLFAGIMLVAALLVISARNPVHSVLWLILAFFNAAGLFLLLGAEFLAMALVIVYVGAVAVLFLFVVMMLDINFEQLRRGFAHYLPIGLVIAGVLVAELLIVGGLWGALPVEAVLASPTPATLPNTQSLGLILYTDYVYVFQAAGLVLLVAMIGAIVLTHQRRPGVRRQTISAQNARRPQDAIARVAVKSGSNGMEDPA